MMKKRTAIVGTRTFNDYEKFCQFLKTQEVGDTIVTGDAKGTDAMARLYAAQTNRNLYTYRADWRVHGLKAGPLRNQMIVDNADELIAFWDGRSKGTKNSISLASQKSIPVHVYFVEASL